MKAKLIYIVTLLMLSMSCQQEVPLEQVQVMECAPMPDPVVASCYAVYGDELYLFGGRTNAGTYSNAFWKYSPILDEWTLLDTAPLKARVSSSACVSGDKIYMGMGYTGPLHRDTAYLRDFWAYAPATKTWQRLADFPANTTVKNCLFAHKGMIYAIYGFYRQFTRDVYRYDIARNQWEKMNVHAEDTIPRAMDIVGATCQGRHFFGTGFSRKSQRFWAEWLPDSACFVPKQDILGAGRNAVACCATEEHIYLAGGRHYGDTLTTGFFYNTIQRYSPLNNRWEYVGGMSGKAENMVMASLNGQIYIGLGETPEGKIKNTWYKLEE